MQLVRTYNSSEWGRATEYQKATSGNLSLSYELRNSGVLADGAYAYFVVTEGAPFAEPDVTLFTRFPVKEPDVERVDAARKEFSGAEVSALFREVVKAAIESRSSDLDLGRNEIRR